MQQTERKNVSVKSYLIKGYSIKFKIESSVFMVSFHLKTPIITDHMRCDVDEIQELLHVQADGPH